MGRRKKSDNEGGAGEGLEEVSKLVKSGKSKPFRLADMVEPEKEARRFGLSVEDVRDAMSGVQEEAELRVTVSRRKEELQQYLQHLYDTQARKWSFESMAEMMATAHAKIVAQAIVNPGYSKEAIATLRDVAKILYAPDKMSVTRRLAAGDSREALLRRLSDRIRQDQPAAIEAQVLGTSDMARGKQNGDKKQVEESGFVSLTSTTAPNTPLEDPTGQDGKDSSNTADHDDDPSLCAPTPTEEG